MEELGEQFIEEMHELSEKGGGQKIQQFGQSLEATEKRIAEIDSIYVYQAEGIGKERKQRVEINYRFLAGSQ